MDNEMKKERQEEQRKESERRKNGGGGRAQKLNRRCPPTAWLKTVTPYSSMSSTL